MSRGPPHIEGGTHREIDTTIDVLSLSLSLSLSQTFIHNSKAANGCHLAKWKLPALCEYSPQLDSIAIESWTAVVRAGSIPLHADAPYADFGIVAQLCLEAPLNETDH
ncbi:hypothetical protein GOP47_0028816 [Adiantum capillus-veneris]|nr:hypothetical protein GOP47_0028816 [Adiantum capillus-veneris]